MNPSIHFLGTTKYYLTAKGEVEGKHRCTILSLTENLQLWPLTIDLSDCETRSQMGGWTRMLSQILDPFVTITSFRTSLLALGLSHGWAILQWWHLFVAHINCCNSLARGGPGGSVALTQCVRCSVHTAQCTFRGSKGRGGWWEKYTAEQMRHSCCSTKLWKTEHYKIEALKACGEWIQREGEKSRAQEGGSNWQETPAPPLLMLVLVLLLLVQLLLLLFIHCLLHHHCY